MFRFSLFSATKGISRIAAQKYHTDDPTKYMLYALSQFNNSPSFYAAVQKGYVDPKSLAGCNPQETAKVIKKLLIGQQSEKTLSYLEKNCFTIKTLMESPSAVRNSYMKDVLCSPKATPFTTLAQHEAEMSKYDMNKEIGRFSRDFNPN